MATLRLKGLNSRMQRVREQLVAGIPAEQAGAFRSDIKDTIERVEQACAAQRSTPRQLPRPSYQAYRFLKTLDLDHLPLNDAASLPAPSPLHIRHLLLLREQIQSELGRIANADSPFTLDDPPIVAVIARLQATAARVEASAQAQSHVARLPLPSRRAYEWIKFLSAPENLILHLNALRGALHSLKQVEGQRRYAGGFYRLSVEFYHTESEWSVRRKGSDIHATFGEGFVGADSTVIDALVRLAFVARRKQYYQIAKEYAAGPDFAEMLQTIELSAAELDPNVRGRHYDLKDVFDRVNADYFDGRLTPPRMMWNKSRTFRLMGHYQYATDTVMISISLDEADVPAYAIDHVMHHELLHRVLGAQIVNGRRYAHTQAFRAAERTFRDYARADAFLNQLSAKLKRRR